METPIKLTIKIVDKKYNWLEISKSNCAWDTALDAKIKIGIYKGNINNDNNMPEFLTPTMSEAPMVPIRLKLGVAKSKVNINTLILSPSKNRSTPQQRG